MAKNEKSNKNNKKPRPSVKVEDLSPQKNPTGGLYSKYDLHIEPPPKK